MEESLNSDCTFFSMSAYLKFCQWILNQLNLILAQLADQTCYLIITKRNFEIFSSQGVSSQSRLCSKFLGLIRENCCCFALATGHITAMSHKHSDFFDFCQDGDSENVRQLLLADPTLVHIRNAVRLSEVFEFS